MSERGTVKGARGPTRGDPAEALRQVAHALAGGRFEAGLAMLDALEEDGRPRARVDMHGLLRARALYRLGRIAEARLALDQVAPERVPATLDLLVRRAEQVRTGDADGLIATAASLAEHADRAADLDHLATLHLAAGDHDEAERVARRAIALDPARPRPYLTLLQALAPSEDLERLAQIVAEAAVRADPFPAFPRHVLLYLLTRLPPARAEDLARALTRRGAAEAALFGPLIGKIIRGEKGGVETVHPVVRHALEGRLDEAIAAAGALPDGVRAVNMLPVASIEEVLRAFPSPRKGRRPLVEDDGSAFQTGAPSSTGTTILVFCGFGGIPMTAIGIIDAFCAEAGAAAAYARDTSHRFFLNGIPELGTDVASSLEALKDHLDRLGTKRLVAVGSSVGGFAAMRYGPALGAQAIVCLSTPTTGASEDVRAMGDERGIIASAQLEHEFGAAALDIAPQLEAHARKVPEGVHLWFGADEAVDAAHARRVARCEGVHLHPLEGYGHHPIVSELIRRGLLAEALMVHGR